MPSQSKFLALDSTTSLYLANQAKIKSGIDRLALPSFIAPLNGVTRVQIDRMIFQVISKSQFKIEESRLTQGPGHVYLTAVAAMNVEAITIDLIFHKQLNFGSTTLDQNLSRDTLDRDVGPLQEFITRK